MAGPMGPPPLPLTQNVAPPESAERAAIGMRARMQPVHSAAVAIQRDGFRMLVRVPIIRCNGGPIGLVTEVCFQQPIAKLRRSISQANVPVKLFRCAELSFQRHISRARPCGDHPCSAHVTKHPTPGLSESSCSGASEPITPYPGAASSTVQPCEGHLQYLWPGDRTDR
jgi:hypothetical protein